MASYVPISNGLMLIEQEVKSKKTVTIREKINHLWIYDRSGSMTGLLPELTAQLIDLSKSLPKGDTLSIGWFSSEGDFNWVFKGFKITDDSDYKTLEKAIKSNSTPRGCTCFSEILADTDTVIKDLSAISKTFAFHFFTDGYPVVSNHQKEIAAIFAAIKKIKGKLQAAAFLGYGSYYNKELMTEMAEKMGAMLLHSSQIPEYKNSITKLIQLSETSESKEEVDALVDKPLAIFSVTDSGVVNYSLDEEGKLLVNPTKGKSTYLYYVADTKQNKNWSKVDIKDINFGSKDDRLAKALYAGALVLTQQTKTDIAMEIIGKVGDKAIVDAMTNAFTIEEYGAVEEAINKCIVDLLPRFSNGRDSNYLPPVDAFCVFDLLNLLMNDTESAFFPYHEKFQYERIGVASHVKEGYSKFSPDKSSKCPYTTLTWHESHLNLSVQTKINGTIVLQNQNGKTPEKLGFANPYPTYVFRNFSFIKDGRVNIKKFYVSTSEATYNKMKNLGLVFDDTFTQNGNYGLDISKLPAVNRKIATGKTSAKEICKMAIAEQKLKAKIKSLKWVKDEEFGDEPIKTMSFTDDQAEFLKANGIMVDKGGSYNPPRETEEAKDKYMAKCFDIKIAGLNTLPPVKKVAEKIAAGKARTPVEALVEEGLKQYKAANLNGNKKEWLETTISAHQKELRNVRSTIQQCKFSVIMGKQWFFSSREENSLSLDGNEFKFELSEEEVEI